MFGCHLEASLPGSQGDRQLHLPWAGGTPGAAARTAGRDGSPYLGLPGLQVPRDLQYMHPGSFLRAEGGLNLTHVKFRGFGGRVYRLIC